METASIKTTRGQKFISFVIEKMKKDTAFGAALRRADNPATEYHAWEFLAPWCDLDKSWERIAFATIAAAVARKKPRSNGTEGIGSALAYSYSSNKADPAKAKLRRLLACSSVEEACTILRPILSLIASKGGRINYAQLLDQLLYFSEKTKVRWATDFYGRRIDDDSDGV